MLLQRFHPSLRCGLMRMGVCLRGFMSSELFCTAGTRIQQKLCTVPGRLDMHRMLVCICVTDLEVVFWRLLVAGFSPAPSRRSRRAQLSSDRCLIDKTHIAQLQCCVINKCLLGLCATLSYGHHCLCTHEPNLHRPRHGEVGLEVSLQVPSSILSSVIGCRFAKTRLPRIGHAAV